MKIYDIAFVCRSKNAGPFQLTVDLMFKEKSFVIDGLCGTIYHTV